ncbi:Serine/threonine-protein kinase pkn1 [Planctomycetes bacterium CA13]|uniref:Serine/threonine-protein kinase pkn1 n=1 Tax=Novipirellula herctigrandis TaxID=2527986 RepID=A0A5C5YPE9_9BACT|nr:Serine/threonine-protein kinase pkn1 [Planctomycetes bacterium CA13]
MLSRSPSSLFVIWVAFAFTLPTLSSADDLVLPLADAVATSQAEMKPYAEAIEHTDQEIEMMPIPGGTFLMGSPDSEANRRKDEGPQHEVSVAPFWIGKYEITWDQYDAWSEKMDQLRRQMMSLAASPRDALVDGVSRPTEPYTDMSFGMGKGQFPAICMTQHAARKFCQWLSVKTGRYYRLPTEAEWEYAARAGTTTSYSFGEDSEQLDDHAWYFDNSDDAYHEIGLKKPNLWGLHDMHGNVAEWVLDQYIADGYSQNANTDNPLTIPTTLFPRVVRGGSWNNDPAMLRSAAREGSSAKWKDQDPQLPQSIWYLTDALGVGFRIVRPLTEPTELEKTEKWANTAPEQKDQE